MATNQMVFCIMYPATPTDLAASYLPSSACKKLGASVYRLQPYVIINKRVVYF